MLPAQQRLDPDQDAAIHLRLIVELEIFRSYRLAEVFFHRGAGVDGGLQGWGEEMQGVAACCLGLIHRDIRLLQNFVCAVFWISEDGNSYAGTAAALAAI